MIKKKKCPNCNRTLIVYPNGTKRCNYCGYTNIQKNLLKENKNDNKESL